MQERPEINETIEELANRIANKIEERLLQRTQNSKTDQYLSRRQLSELLDVDLATLYRWSKSGVLPSHRLGGKIIYKIEDIEAQMKRVPNLKDGRA